MRLFHLYRPAVPSVRAQSVQVIHTCHALAHRGHDVTLVADRPTNSADDVTTPEAALAAYGLDLPPTFHLERAWTRWPPGAGWGFRAALWRWCAGAGSDDIVYVRAKKYVAAVPRRLRVVVEAHEVDSELARERGEDPGPWRALEASVLARASGVVTNGRGTMALLEATHPLPMPHVVIENATRADRAVARHPDPTPVVGYTGSPRAYKGLQHVFTSLPLWPAGVTFEMIGGAPDGPLPPGVRARPAVAYGALPAELARFHALLLPLDDNLFGRALTNPLKLWDYLATGIPIVAADLPGIREIGGDSLHYYRPGDPASLAAAVTRALAAGSSPRIVRTWDDRAAEIEAFLLGLGRSG